MTVKRRQRLRAYDPTEISFVPRPANFKKFLIHKSAGEPMPSDRAASKAEKELEKLILALPQATFDKIDKSAATATDNAGLPASAAAALKAVGRIIAPYADVLTDAHMDAIQAAVGMNSLPDSGDQDDATDAGDADNEAASDADDSAGDPDPDAAADAEGQDAADAAPPADAAHSTPQNSSDILAESMGSLPDGVTQQQMDMAIVAAKKAFSDALERVAVNKAAQGEGPMPEQSAQTTKDDAAQGSVTISADMAKQITDVLENNKQLIEKSAKSDERIASLESELAGERSLRLDREYATRADAYKSLGSTEEIAQVLKSAHGNADQQGKLEAILKSAVERTQTTQAYDGDMFGEVGSRQGGTSDSDVKARLEDLRKQRIEKSAGDNESAEQALSHQIRNTAEGRKLYNDLVNQLHGGR